VVPADTTPPTVPTNLTATAVSVSQINLSWTAATDNVGVAGYHVFRDGGATPIATVTGSAFSDTGLTTGTAHTYAVSAFDAAGNESAPSIPASATTLVSADTQPPTAPTNLTATAAGTSQINLAWRASRDNVGVAGYHVFRDGGATPIATLTGTSFSDTGLAAGSTHTYTVAAVDAAGNQSAQSSPPASATTLTPPATPTPTALPTASATPAATATPILTVGVPRGIIPHGALVLLRVRARPDADAIITLRLTRRDTRCSGAAQRRVCASVTTVLAQRVVHARTNGQGLVTQRVALGYTPTRTLRATLWVRVWTRHGAATHEAVVLLQPAPRARQR
jgi:chitodextrinase